ncbi:putative periplasmic serine endoprotease DegP-like [Syntrophobacter sp. SbD2]|nr:putative periplasmic serine endoprotease DegP-like [Syntrophobacter sp. SbD2]
MFKRISNSFNKRFGIKTIMGVGLACALTGLLASGMFDSIGRAAAEPGVIHSQTGTELPVITSPFTALAEKCTPSVVNVKVTKVEKTGFGEMQIPWAPFGDFFNHPRFPQDRTVQGAGSGVIISKDGYILTNNHVVEGAKELTVTLADKGEFKAQIVGEDPKTDLAIVKIDAGENLPAANIGDSDQIKVGDWVLAIGNPFGLGDTVTSGIVSGKGRVIGAGPYDDFIQTDASINPGNSGGPLFNMKGEVIGINTAIISGGQGIGFAIPVNTAKPLIPELEAKGEVTRGYLGANIQSITPDLSKALKMEQSKGALVAEVVPDGPADKAGIKAGDVIVSFDGKAVHDSHDLPAMVAATAIGRQVPITLIRNGKEIQIAAVIAKLESGGSRLAESKLPAQGKWGLQLQDLNAETERQLGFKAGHGVVVAGVQPASPAQRAFIKPGDVILEVNRQAVRSVNDLKEKIAGAEGSDSLLLLVKNAQGSRYVVLKG